ncbi:MAG TPA: FhaA domain-containing protein [Candidatus Baltobacteraceae bacterium]|nr:FhaA domain-containing protein [Candidatus Baltobacteraceae bacterium]
MSWLARIEETCAAFIERAFANMFPSDVEPAQIARKLVATMEARTQSGQDGMLVPSRYAVSVSRSDYDRLLKHRTYLEKEWSVLLEDVAERVGVRFAGGAPSVELLAREGIVPGAIEIEAADAQEPGTGARLTLRVIAGPNMDRVYAVDDGMHVGRNPGCDLVLSDPSVSRKHAALRFEEHRLVVADEGSSNGTFVNGKRIKERVLRVGDVVGFGKTQLRLERT